MKVSTNLFTRGIAVAVIGCGLTMGAFAGGAKDEKSAQPAAQPAAQPMAKPAAAGPFDSIDLKGVSVTFWHQHTSTREEGLKKMVAEFNATNPYGIVVNAEYAGGYSDIYNKMLAGLSAKQVPDLVVAYQNQAGAYQLVGGLADIDPYVVDAKYGLSKADQADFIPGIFAQDKNAQFGNARLGFPPNRSMEVLYYNADWLTELGFSAPPKTWAEFETMVAKATEAGKGTYGYPISTDASNLFAMTISRGADYYSADKAAYNFDKPQIAEALAFIKKIYDAGYGRKIAERYGDQTDFGNRKVLFTIGSSSGLPFYQQAVDKGTAGKFNWSVAALPQSGSGKPRMNMYGASISIVKTTGPKQLASWLFLKWMTEPAQQRLWTELSGYFPTRASVRDSLGDYLKKEPKFAAAFNVLLSSEIVTEPPFSSYEAVRREISAAMNAVLDGADVKKTLVDLTAKANKINAEDK